MTADLCFLPATVLAQQIRSGECSVREVMEAHLAQIEKVNPLVNAIVTYLPDQAMEQAAKADEAIARGEKLGALHGLPVAHKDMALTKGIRTTFGSRIYQNFVPEHDELIVERLKNAGAIAVGKTNTPEFGAGSQTFNDVFGATLNPYDTGKTCGGSSGGAAVALACGMIPIADGGDFGGSLRNPASFCNVVGFRSSPGRVPMWPHKVAWVRIPVQGPLARTVEDIALLMSVMAGHDSRSPIALSESADLFHQPIQREFKDSLIAWSLDLGELPLDSSVKQIISEQRAVFEAIGCRTEEAHPDFADVEEIFHTERAWLFELKYAQDLQNHRELIKDTVISEIESGMRLSGPDIGRAVVKQTALYQRVLEFMENYEFLILPVSQVPPFDMKQPYVDEIEGVPLKKYTDWMKSCWYISVTGLPAISVPCGFTDEGLPVGIQIVGRARDDWGVLQMAYAFEQATQCWKHRPEIA